MSDILMLSCYISKPQVAVCEAKCVGFDCISDAGAGMLVTYAYTHPKACRVPPMILI